MAARGGRTGRAWAGDARQIDPNLRFSHYVDAATGWPVLLNRQFLIDKLQGAENNLAAVERWKYMPQNWLNILLEVPRSVVKKPFVLMSGDDPNQDGYIGWVNANKTWGGAVPDHNGIVTALKFFDILEVFPDHVDRFYDPSQFPARVVIDAPLAPSQNVFDKDVRADERDLSAGREYWKTAVRYGNQGPASTRSSGSSPTSRAARAPRCSKSGAGMAGAYSDSKVVLRSGPASIERALRDQNVASRPVGPDGRIAADVETRPLRRLSQRTDQAAVRVTTPGPVGLSVDQVTKRVRIQPGAEQARQAYQRWGELGPSIEAARQAALKDQVPIRDALARAEQRTPDGGDRPAEGRRGGSGALERFPPSRLDDRHAGSARGGDPVV